MSKFIDWQDRSTCVYSGMARALLYLSPQGGQGGHLNHLFTDGNLWDFICLPEAVLKSTFLKTIKDRLHFVKMKGNETFK